MAQIEIVPVNHLDERVHLEPNVEHRITELVSITTLSDGASEETLQLKVRVVAP